MSLQQPPRFFIGWDVGGWNCDKNRESRDAIVILDTNLDIVGAPWRGNLRDAINRAETTREWLERLFSFCGIVDLPDELHALLAIDTPLGFSESFRQLVCGYVYEETIGESAANPYLLRDTERFLFENGLKPLSPIKDMIGSQATKGIHVLAKFAPHVLQCGVWSDNNSLTVIEAYPSACKHSETIRQLRSQTDLRWEEPFKHQDETDAFICALIGYLFAVRPDALAQPRECTTGLEGWIWVPRDALGQNKGARPKPFHQA